jgi:hypothetical protein
LSFDKCFFVFSGPAFTCVHGSVHCRSVLCEGGRKILRRRSLIVFQGRKHFCCLLLQLLISIPSSFSNSFWFYLSFRTCDSGYLFALVFVQIPCFP